MEVSHHKWSVQPRYGLLRRILFPIYGRDQLIFFAVLLIIGVLLFAMLDPELALYTCLGGYVGAMLMMEISTPSSLWLPTKYEEQLVQMLDGARFLRRTGNGNEWINARGRLYRWDTDIIRLKRTSNGLLVTGRHYDLSLIAEDVRT